MINAQTEITRLQVEVATLKQLLDVHEQQSHTCLSTIMHQQKEIEERSQKISVINEKLRKTTNFLEELYRTMPCALIVVDENGVIVAANQGADALLEYDKTELIGEPLSKVFVNGTVPDLTEIEMLAAKGDVLCIEKECLAKNGKTIPVHFSAGMISNTEGTGRTNYGVVCILLDIRDQKRLEIELRQAQKLESIGQLAAGIAHEINTPTQYIGDNTRFLRDAFEDLEPILSACKDLIEAEGAANAPFPSAELLESLRRSDIQYLLQEIPLAIEQSLEGVGRVSKIVQSMKEFSHPGTNKKQAIDLNRAIESTLTVARNEWKYVADLQLDLAPDLPPVICLPGDMNQVFLNLIVNAAHAMEAKLGQSPREKAR